MTAVVDVGSGDTLSFRVAAIAATAATSALHPTAELSLERDLLSTLVLGFRPYLDERDRAVEDLVRTLGSPPQATILVSGDRVGAAYAALVNAASMARPDEGRPIAPLERRLRAVVVSAALAIAELDGVTGVELGAGILVGLEVSERLREALGPGHAGRGWDLAGTAGRIGATVAAGRVGNLTPDQMLAAIGFGSTQSAGLAACAELAPLTVSRSACDAVEGALLARAGLVGPSAPIEGRRGLFALEHGSGDPEIAFAGFGEQWRTVHREPRSGTAGQSRFDAAAGALAGATVPEILSLAATFAEET
jgi:2-methylcitrate dehydratase PrpD